MNRLSIKKTYICAALFVLVSVIIYGATLRALQDSRQESEKIETKLALENDTQFFRSALEKAMQESAADRSRLETHFVRKDGVVDFINGLEKLGTDTGVEAKISSLGESWKDEKGGSLSLSLHVTGNFANIYSYLLLLEQVPQKLVLDEVQLLSTENSAAPATIKATAPHVIVWAADIRPTVVHYIK